MSIVRHCLPKSTTHGRVVGDKMHKFWSHCLITSLFLANSFVHDANGHERSFVPLHNSNPSGFKFASNELAKYELLTVTQVSHKIVKRGTTDSSDDGPSKRHIYDHLEEIRFAALNREFRLILNQKQRSIVSPRFKIFTVNAAGNKKPYIDLDQSEFYEGRLFGSLNSSVTAHIDRETGLLTASIIDSDKNEMFVVEPSWRHQSEGPTIYNASDANSMIVYKVNDLQFGPSLQGATFKSTKGKSTLSPVCGYVESDDDQVPFTFSQRNNHNHSDQVLHKFSVIRPKRAAFDVVHSDSLDYTRCSLLVVADYLFYQKMGGENVKQTVSFLVSVIDRVNSIFLATDWSDPAESQRLTGFGFFVHEILVHDEPNLGTNHYNNHERQWDVRNLLKAFSRQDHRSYCLAHLFTHRKFDHSVLGLAYVASPLAYRAGGICSTATASEGHTFYFNTGLTSTMNSFGQSLITRTADLVTAHELGHNWGAEHDPDTQECSPKSRRGGAYVMYAYSVGGYDNNNKVFSPCSKRAIRNVILEKSGKCFIEEAKSYCGNGIVEEGEECDAGHEGQRGSDICCDNDCRFKPGADCSWRNSPCCNDRCRVVPGGSSVCSRGNKWACLKDSYCDGSTAECPDPDHVDNGEDCLDQGKCSNGYCIPYCETRGLYSCMCDDEKNACKRCCRRTVHQNSTCEPVKLASLLVDGTPCVHGFCEKGRCEKSVQDVVQRFWDVIEEINPNTFYKFLKDNIVGVVIVVTALLWIPICYFIDHYDNKNRSDMKQKGAQTRQDLMRPSTSSERSNGTSSMAQQHQQSLQQPLLATSEQQPRVRSDFGRGHHSRNPAQRNPNIIRAVPRARRNGSNTSNGTSEIVFQEPSTTMLIRSHNHDNRSNHAYEDNVFVSGPERRYSRGSTPSIVHPGNSSSVGYSTRFGLNFQPHVVVAPHQHQAVHHGHGMAVQAPIAYTDEADDDVDLASLPGEGGQLDSQSSARSSDRSIRI